MVTLYKLSLTEFCLFGGKEKHHCSKDFGANPPSLQWGIALLQKETCRIDVDKVPDEWSPIREPSSHESIGFSHQSSTLGYTHTNPSTRLGLIRPPTQTGKNDLNLWDRTRKGHFMIRSKKAAARGV
jgi:hypothetical protein